MDNICNKVVTIPQYLGTCWFNSILMSLLYSQYSRKLLINKRILGNKDDKLLIVLNKILHKYYISPEKAIKYFKIIRPETILGHMDISKKLLKEMVNNGWFLFIFYHKFLKRLDISHIVLDYYKDNIIIGMNERVDFDVKSNIFKLTPIRSEFKYFKEIKEKLETKNPDYILINVWNNIINNEYNLQYTNKINTLLKFPELQTTLNFDNYEIPYIGIRELEKEITYNGDTYILDSCLINNYNDVIANNTKHVICGITCKDSGYVYNGWIRTMNDDNSSLTPDIINKELLPCELMKFDWDIHSHNRFCLNTKLCNIKKISKSDNKNKCYSFNKGERTLVYVKKTGYLSVDDNISASPPAYIKSPIQIKKINEKKLLERFNKLVKQYDDSIKIPVKKPDIKKPDIKKLKVINKTNLINIKILKDNIEKKKIELDGIKDNVKMKKEVKKIREGLRKIREGIKKLQEENKENRKIIKLKLMSYYTNNDKVNDNKMTKKDYLYNIKKLYPYYVNLESYCIDDLKKIYTKVCNNINLRFNNQSCYIDSLLVSLFNSKNDKIEKILLQAPINNYDKAPELNTIAKNIQLELNKIYKVVSLQTKSSKTLKCNDLRQLLQR